MRRHARQVAHLVNRHPQRDPNLGIEPRRRASRKFRNQEIELPLVAQRTEHDLGGEAGIARIEPDRAREQQVGSIPAALDEPQDVKRGHPRRRDHSPYAIRPGMGVALNSGLRGRGRPGRGCVPAPARYRRRNRRLRGRSPGTGRRSRRPHATGRGCVRADSQTARCTALSCPGGRFEWHTTLPRRRAGLTVSSERRLRELLSGRRRDTYRVIYKVEERAKLVLVLTIRHGARKLTDFSALVRREASGG